MSIFARSHRPARTNLWAGWRIALLPLIAIAVMTGLLPSASTASGSELAQQGHFATYQGVVTLDGEPAPQGTQVVLLDEAGSTWGVARTNGDGQQPGHYTMTVGGSYQPPSGPPLTLTVSGVAYFIPVQVQFIPGTTVTADIAAYSSVPETLPDPGDGQAFISVPQSVNISPQSTATGPHGAGVGVTGGTLRLPAVGGSVSVPVALRSGWVLETLDDPVTGITIRRTGDVMLIRIPFRDDDGNDTIRVLVETEELVGTGSAATGEIVGMGIDLPTRTRDFSTVDPAMGEAGIKVIGNLSSFPADAFIEMNLLDEPAPAEVSRIMETLVAEGEEISEVGYAVQFVKTGLDVALEDVTLRFDIWRAWYEMHSEERIVVMRLADDGAIQTFDAVPVDPEADPVQFQLNSPDGLSTFVITAVRKAQEPTPTPTPTSPPTATPTATPPPTATATPTPRPFPTDNGGPTALPTATATPAAPTATLAPPTPTTQPAQSPTSVPPAPTVPAAPAATNTGSCSAGGDGPFTAGNAALLLAPLLPVALRRRPWLM